ncbi:S41 family peptidase, partial [Falsiroseomonas sp.]|uniref:S41 family peptidase n=1 Tax=Falsiroseomonas sp. TaxID=2870721 RepID=UPI002732795F
MLTRSHSLILERHLEAASPVDLVLWSLRGLAVLDTRFNAELRGDGILLLGEDRVLATGPLAPLTRPGTASERGTAVAMTLEGFYDAAWRASPQLRQAGAERMLASGFEELFNHLDPYSRYMTAEEARAARERRVGQSGLGLRVAVERGALVIDALTRDGPAALAGIRTGDRLLAVDGRALGPRDPGLAARLLEGPEGSEVTLTVLRAGRRRNFTLLREMVVPETVLVERGNDILFVRLTGFSAVTDRRLTQVLRDSFAEGVPRGVVLDLRGNRGGLLSQAVAVADAFLTDGEVMRTEGRHPDANRRYLAGGQDLAAGLPVVVLVDGRTASSAEIVAAALAERGRAVVVGSATMG